MKKCLSYNFHYEKNAYLRIFLTLSVSKELYEIVW